MGRKGIWVVSVLVVVALLTGCAAKKPLPSFAPMDLQALLQSGKKMPKVDNFMVIMDASGSMSLRDGGYNKLEQVKRVASRMNQTIPDMALKAGAIAFGTGSCMSWKNPVVILPFSDYDRKELEKAIDAVKCSGGPSPLGAAMDTATANLAGAAGKTAVIVISDGLQMDGSPISAAQKMKKTFGDRVCIYTVQIGDEPEGRILLERIAQIGGCGFATTSDAVLTDTGMGLFVERVFLQDALDSDGDGVFDSLDKCPDTPKGVKVDASGCPLDTDGDGVPDYLDKCPGTPKGVKVDASGCPLDTDGDGVPDYLDKCPGTPVGAKVNAEGCWILAGLLFDFDKAVIKPQYTGELDAAVAVLRKNPGLSVDIYGHTDNVGSAAYNVKLGAARAEAVKNYFVSQGIAADRLSTESFGFSRPVTTNETDEGRARNRRVELHPKK